MAERRRLAEIPLPTALSGKGFGEVGQVWHVIRRDNFSFDALTVVAEKRFGYGFANLLVGNIRQQFNQVRHAPTHGGNPLCLELFLVWIQIIGQSAEVCIQQ
ncbi:hypothetical protein NGUA18_04889 [Salmonella enterica]|nr:hypothetical protein NGUA18_04889 [Salmonella enterica]